MRIKYTFTFFFAIFIYTLNAQEFNQSLDKDSLYHEIIKNNPDFLSSEIEKMYTEGNEQTKEFLLVMFSMPKSSKAELIDNYQENQKSLIKLRDEYEYLVPDGLTVEIEFNPENKIISMPPSLDFKIYSLTTKKWNNEWNIEFKSKKLDSMLNKIGWTHKELNYVQKLLISANCISIENGEYTTVGFARSGMGKYYYRIYNHDLTSEEIENVNDDCMYIYYMKNIVFEYGSGAIGSLCFPD